MTHTLVIETQNDVAFEQVKRFAQRIGVSFSEKHTDPDLTSQQDALKTFFGSWEGEETGDELVEIIYGARNDQPRDVDL